MRRAINRDQLIEYVHEYFENLYDTRQMIRWNNKL